MKKCKGLTTIKYTKSTLSDAENTSDEIVERFPVRKSSFRQTRESKRTSFWRESYWEMQAAQKGSRR
jgi:hypothetical protein